MTAQISDVYLYKRNEYCLIASENGILFDIEKEYNIKCRAPHTALWRGHCFEFNINNKALILKDLSLCVEGDYPTINGVDPINGDVFDFGLKKYLNVNIPVNYTGAILLGRELLDEYYIHMGFQQPYSYKEVIELNFLDGILQSKSDYSEEMKNYRRLDKGTGKYKWNKFIDENFSYESFIHQCFSTSYKDKVNPFM